MGDGLINPSLYQFIIEFEHMKGEYTPDKLHAMSRQLQSEIKWASTVEQAAASIRREAELRDPNDNSYIQEHLKKIESFISGHKYAAECVEENIKKKLAY